MSYKIKINKDEFRSKLHGCWMGKAIGGAIGMPYELTKDINDATGFSTPKGEPVPNDDLDLQLIWLLAMEDMGPKALSANALADYWLTYITPHWNEYGVCRANMEMGLLPPLSGHFKNKWLHSNGAWIRSEIWASLAPGVPNIAMKYALMDACLDHGLGEGTYAEMFTVTMQSFAMYEKDVRKLIETALTYIPHDCRVAQSVRLVLEYYDSGRPWKETREAVVKLNDDLGLFQAPGNVAFTVLGLMYGEGDFKKSVLLCVNCGDDADCTAATCGALLGLMNGIEYIPEDWKEYIGDRIVTMCINGSYIFRVPKTCSELTERIMNLMPSVMKTYDIDVEYTDEKTNIDEIKDIKILEGYAQTIFDRSPYSFEISNGLHTEALIEYDCEPVVKAGEDFKVKVTLTNNRASAHHHRVDVFLPEGWTADYDRTCFSDQRTRITSKESKWEMTIHVGERVDSVNRIPIMISTSSHAVPVMIPIVLLG